MSALVITPGDPRGIGPEVSCRALALRLRSGERLRATLVGDESAIRRAASEEGLVFGDEIRCVGLSDEGEPVEVKAIRWAVRSIASGEHTALVTGPIHKDRLIERGFAFTGHTDFLGHLTKARPVMAFVGGRLRVVLATVHVPLSRVPSLLTVNGLVELFQISLMALKEQLGLSSPKLLVCGLNPHAGESGRLGLEEQQIIGPAVQLARSLGLEVTGPISAEAAFRQAYAGEVDAVVAMYHDQGLVPLKLVDFGRSVNWTMGLPLVRTSVDHGTALDIAWTRSADARSMDAAIALALRLSGVEQRP